MGILYCLHRVSDEDIRLVRAQPVQSLYLAFGSDFKPIPPTPPALGLLDRIMRKKPSQVPTPTLPTPARDWPEPDPSAELFLDKAWEPMNVIFTGGEYTSPWPNDFLVDESKTVYGGGEGELWDFPILAFDSADVRAIAEWLDSTSREKLASRFENEVLADWGLDWLSSETGEQQAILDNVDVLREWMRDAARRGGGVIGVIS